MSHFICHVGLTICLMTSWICYAIELISPNARKKRKKIKFESQTNALEQKLLTEYEHAGWGNVSKFEKKRVKEFKKDNAERYLKEHLLQIKKEVTTEFYFDFLQFMQSRIKLINNHNKDHYHFHYIAKHFLGIIKNLRNDLKEPTKNILKPIVDILKYYDSDLKIVREITETIESSAPLILPKSKILSKLLRKYPKDSDVSREIIQQLVYCEYNKKNTKVLFELYEKPELISVVKEYSKNDNLRHPERFIRRIGKIHNGDNPGQIQIELTRILREYESFDSKKRIDYTLGLYR